MGSKKEPLVTIAMVFHNEADNLHLAIQSIINQTYTNWELLLWDDGSTDASLSIAQSFKDHRIKLFVGESRRALSNRLNSCIKVATGKYFARMDADDIAYPERLATQVQFLEQQTNVDLVATYVAIIDPDGKLLGKMGGPTDHIQIIKHPLLGFRMFHPTWVGHLSWFRLHQYNEESVYSQDQDLLYRSHRESVYAVIPQILLAYRQDHLNVKKLLRQRLVRMKHVNKYLRGPRFLPLKVGVAALFSLKASLDVFAVVSGLGYRLLRHRARPLSQEERKAYLDTVALLNYSQSMKSVVDMTRCSN